MTVKQAILMVLATYALMGCYVAWSFLKPKKRFTINVISPVQKSWRVVGYPSYCGRAFVEFNCVDGNKVVFGRDVVFEKVEEK